MTFLLVLVVDTKFVTCSYFQKIIIPLFPKLFSSLFSFNLCVLPTLRVFLPPSFDYDPFMRHTIHLLDAYWSSVIL